MKSTYSIPIAWVVYQNLDLSLLRKAWLNLDLVWAVALIATRGLTLLLPGPAADARWVLALVTIRRMRKSAGDGREFYSSGSVLAQRLLFRYSEAGDLTRWIEAYFDTATGAKTEAASYRRIAEKLGAEAQETDEALQRLAAHEPRKSKIVELRCLGGLTYEETAAALEISTATVLCEMRMAKAWLRRELASETCHNALLLSSLESTGDLVPQESRISARSTISILG
jgi:DNA-directed RNA polymerase specialized sigma24 family protein